jgi:hypothetical protein
MNKIPAIPPEDYKGTIANWMISLEEEGLWDGTNPEWYGDVLIDESDWWKILEECERP